MVEIEPYLEALAKQAHCEGGWGYGPGKAAHLEPTCLALLALSLDAERFREPIDKAWNFVNSCARADGTYRWNHGRDEAVWPTALVLLVQAVLKQPEDRLRRTAAALLAIEARKHDSVDDAQAIHDIDLKLQGWPWAEKNFSWAEPTAWACLALRHSGLGGQPRVEEGMRLLLDRTADNGGINYGNRRILGKLTDPIPSTTALMLLALQGHAEHPRVAASVRYLQEQSTTSTDLEHLCWARLALELYRDLPGVLPALATLRAKIVQAHHERNGTPWLQPAPLRQALTALALGCDRINFFRIGGEAADRQAPAAALLFEPSRSLGDRLRSIVRGLAVRAVTQLRQTPPPSQVHIARARNYTDDLAALVRQQYESFRERVPLKDKRVVLKPNLVEYHRDKVINTDPRVVAAAIELCQAEGAAEVIVAEGPGHWRNVEFLVQESGLGDVLRRYRVPFVDLNHDEPVKLPNLGRLTGLEYLYLSRTTATADVLISLPRVKTHHWAGATLSLKNLFGTLPGICYGWPKNELHWRGIDNSIVDIALTRTPELTIVDGIVGMEGDGPLNGTPKELGALIMGNDLLAVDATCCRLMMLDPERIGYLVLGYRKKLGLLREKEIQQIGEGIESLARPFETVPHFRELHIGRSA